MKTYVTRNLRKEQTPWETKLWFALRNSQIKNFKFRRQYKIGDYIVDFVCLSKKLIVELDGGHHNFEENIYSDKKRQKYLETLGYKVLRIWNNEVDDNLEGIIERIIFYP